MAHVWICGVRDPAKGDHTSRTTWAEMEGRSYDFGEYRHRAGVLALVIADPRDRRPLIASAERSDAKHEIHGAAHRRRTCGLDSLSITAGVCEETIFRGYLQQQFIAWTKSVPAGVIFSAIIFGLGHIYQGLRQAGVIAIFGILFGILAAWRRDVKLGMLAHGWQDSLAGIGEFLATKGYIHIPGM